VCECSAEWGEPVCLALLQPETLLIARSILPRTVGQTLWSQCSSFLEEDARDERVKGPCGGCGPRPCRHVEVEAVARRGAVPDVAHNAAVRVVEPRDAQERRRQERGEPDQACKFDQPSESARNEMGRGVRRSASGRARANGVLQINIRPPFSPLLNSRFPVVRLRGRGQGGCVRVHL